MDGGFQPTLFVTEWQSQRKILNFPLPHKQRSAPVESVSMRYSYQANILGIVENEAGGGYRLMFWEIKNNIMNLIFLNDIEQSSSCFNLLFFETIRGGLQLATVERNCIKYWQFESKKATLVHRIHLRSPVVSASVSRLTNLLCVVDQLGRSAFLDSMVAQYMLNLRVTPWKESATLLSVSPQSTLTICMPISEHSQALYASTTSTPSESWQSTRTCTH